MIHEYIIKVDDSKKDIMGGMPLVEQAKELIRCKECKFWNNDGIIKSCKKHLGFGYFENWFCADGERKE